MPVGSRFIVATTTMCSLLVVGGCDSLSRMLGLPPSDPVVPAVTGQPTHVDMSRYGRVAVVATLARATVDADLSDEHRELLSGVSNGLTAVTNEVLLGKGYGVVDRIDFNSVLEEQKTQSEWGDSTQKAAEIGRIMNVKALLLVRLNSLTVNTPPPFSGPSVATSVVFNVSISAKLVDVERAVVIWQASYSGQQNAGHENEYQRVVETTMRGVAQAFPDFRVEGERLVEQAK